MYYDKDSHRQVKVYHFEYVHIPNIRFSKVITMNISQRNIYFLAYSDILYLLTCKIGMPINLVHTSHT
jgi:hypothetical protein